MALTLRKGAFLCQTKNLACISVAHYNNDLKPIKTPELDSIPRGTGYRSSFNGKIVTIFGATGFIGPYIVNRLGKHGMQLILPYRHFYEAFPLKVAGDLGQVLFTPLDLSDDESIRKAVRHSNVVVNLISREHNTLHYPMERVNIDGAARIARISKEMGVDHLIHFSALNAHPNPEPLWMKHGSQFYKTKWYGEQEVLNEFPEATIFRPADVYGERDRFFNYYAHHYRYLFYTLHLYKMGEATIKQPVYVEDISAAVKEAIMNPYFSKGKTFQAVGPQRFLLKDLVNYMLGWFRRNEQWGLTIMDAKYSFPFQLYLKFRDYSFLQRQNICLLSSEKFEMEATTDKLDDTCLKLEDLGVPLTKFEDMIYCLSYYHRVDHYYEEEIGQFIYPPPPPEARA